MSKKKSRAPAVQESVDDFLARGGQIKRIPTGISSIDPLGPRNKNIRISDKPSAFIAYAEGKKDGDKAL